MNTVNFLNLEHLFLLVYQLFQKEYAVTLPERIASWVHLFQILSTIFSLLLLIGIVYSMVRAYQVWQEHYKEMEAEEAASDVKVEGNPKWKQIMEFASSGNPNDWRQAVIEADIMLGELLTFLGYQGEGIGEQLKAVERGDFPTLDLAWDAHKVRNQIAHEGSDFLLTQREADRVIDLYRRVFESFKFI